MESIEIKLLKLIHNNCTYKDHISIFKDWVCDFDENCNPIFKRTDVMFNYDRFINQAIFEINDNSEDCYFSINSFRNNRRISNDVWHLNAFVLDFDFYKLKKYETLSPKKFYEEYLSDEKLKPTAVVDSGRGLYLIYIFKDAPKLMTEIYKKIYKAFLNKYKQFNLDSNAMKITQLIRLPGSINSKTGRKVKIIQINNTSYCLRDFFHLLSLDILKKAVKRNSNNNKVKYECLNKFDKMNYFHRLMNDFKKLIIIRNNNNIIDGYRELLIYLIRRRARWADLDYDLEISYAYEVNSLFKVPLSDEEIIKVCKPYGNTKPAGIKRMIELLAINEDEMSNLKLLVHDNIRINNSKKKKNKNKLLNLSTKKIEILNRRKEVAELKNRGLKNSEIAEKIKVAKSTITRDLKYIKENPSEFIIVIENYLRKLFKEKLLIQIELNKKKRTDFKVRYHSLE